MTDEHRAQLVQLVVSDLTEGGCTGHDASEGGRNMILAIDPGAKTCACALFDAGKLTEVWFSERPRCSSLDVVVVERMQIDGRAADCDLRHTLDCQWNGALAAGFACASSASDCKIVSLTPTQWKGSQRKPVQHALLFGVSSDLTGRGPILSSAEQDVLGGARTADVIRAAVRKGALDKWSKPGVKYYPAAFDTHNLLDAVALGLFYLGRLGK